MIDKDTLNQIFDRHEIHPDFRSELGALVQSGAKPSPELVVRLDNVDNYAACFAEILHELSKPFHHLFRHLGDRTCLNPPLTSP